MSRGLHVRIAGAIVGAAARVVPRAFRARFVEEWRGEIDAAPAGTPIVRRACGAWRDALTCRRIDARRSAERAFAFGGDGWIADVRFGARMIRRSPGFAAAAVASLSVGLAATTVAFAAINALLFRSLPGVADSTRLAQIVTQAPWLAGMASSAEDYERYRGALSAFGDLAAFAETRVAVGHGSEPSTARAVFATPNYFDLLGTRASAGRTIDASTAHVPVAVVSDEFAVRRFGGVATAVGQSVLVNGVSLQIVGVAPPDFAGVRPGEFGRGSDERPQLWIPLAMRAALTSKTPMAMNRSMAASDTEWVQIVGRLAPGVTMRAAQAQATAVPPHGAAGRRADMRPQVVPLGRGPRDSDWFVATAVALILSIPMIVLAIGCANTANLQLARASHRQAELAVRRSLGATRGRVVRQLLVESLLIASIAGVVGTALTVVLTRVLGSLMPVPVPLDWRVLGFVLAIVSLTGLSCGIAPALGTTRGDLTAPLKDSGASAPVRRSRLRSALVMSQVGLSLLLLVMAGLFTRTLQHLSGLDDARGMSQVAAARIDLRLLKYDAAASRAFQEELLARLDEDPRVVAAAIAPFEPFQGSSGLTYRVAGERDPRRYRYTNGGAPRGRFAEAAGLRIVRGRGFTDADRVGPPRVALVSWSLARTISPSGDVLGQPLVVGDGGQPNVDVAIVGVTTDAALRVGGRDTGILLLPSPLSDDHVFSVWVRTSGDSRSVLPRLRAIVRELDPRLPIEIGTAESLRRETLGPIRWVATGLAAMGTLALLLAAGGLYAVVSYFVERRRHEMAVRLALGATPRQLASLVLGDGLRLSIPGLVAGALVSAAVARVARAMLIGVSPFDPVAFGGVAALLVAVAIAATLVPAYRASRLDPLATLRRQ